jgi:serine/threonine-protein phosphatase CPPED1
MGCKFITLNSQLYFNSTYVPELREAQDKWLDKELFNDPSRPWTHLMIFQHIPLFVKSHDEPAHEYFNIEPVQRKNLLERFKKAGVSKVFCGHYHNNVRNFIFKI